MTDYSKIEQEVDAQADLIRDVASKVWHFTEHGFEEVKSSAHESEALEKNGFKISDRVIAGIDQPPPWDRREGDQAKEHRCQC